MEHHSKSTDRIFHQHGAPALLLSQPICCTILIAIRCIQTSQSIMTAFQMFTFRKLIWISFESNILSVFIYLVINFRLFYLLVSPRGSAISEHCHLDPAWMKHTFTPAEDEKKSLSKLLLFLFISCVFHCTICIFHWHRLRLCGATSVGGRRWVSDVVYVCVCVCACACMLHVGL